MGPASSAGISGAHGLLHFVSTFEGQQTLGRHRLWTDNTARLQRTVVVRTDYSLRFTLTIIGELDMSPKSFQRKLPHSDLSVARLCSHDAEILS